MSSLEKDWFCPELANSVSSSAQRRKQITLLTPLVAFIGPYRFKSRTAGGIWSLPFSLTQTVIRIALKMRKTWRVSSKTSAGGNHRFRILHLSGKILHSGLPHSSTPGQSCQISGPCLRLCKTASISCHLSKAQPRISSWIQPHFVTLS